MRSLVFSQGLRPLVLVAAGVLLSSSLACSPERPPGAEGEREQTGAAAPGGPTRSSTLDPDQDQFVLTYAGERGVFADCSTIEDVPESARAKVGVSVFGKPAPAGQVWLAKLHEPDAEGRYPLQALPREEFEEAVLGSGRASSFALPSGLESVDPVGLGGPVIVYKTSWCGVCKQLEKYLDRKGVEYIAKDIEKDRAAAAELQAKAKAAGVKTGSVPMIDVGGELLRGFDRERLDKLL